MRGVGLPCVRERVLCRRVLLRVGVHGDVHELWSEWVGGVVQGSCSWRGGWCGVAEVRSAEPMRWEWGVPEGAGAGLRKQGGVRVGALRDGCVLRDGVSWGELQGVFAEACGRMHEEWGVRGAE